MQKIITMIMYPFELLVRLIEKGNPVTRKRKRKSNAQNLTVKIIAGPTKKENKKDMNDLNGQTTEHSLIIIADRIDPSKVTTGMGFEKALRDACKKAGVLCIRSDYKNNVPDFLVSNRYGEYVYHDFCFIYE